MCRVYSCDVSMCRDWSVEASGGHGNDPRTASNHGAARDGLGVLMTVHQFIITLIADHQRIDEFLILWNSMNRGLPQENREQGTTTRNG